MQKIVSGNVPRKVLKKPAYCTGNPKIFERKLIGDTKIYVTGSKDLEDAPKKAIARLIIDLHKSFSNPRAFKRILIEFGKKHDVHVDEVTIKMARFRMESMFFSEF